MAIRNDERFAILKGRSRRLALIILSTFLGWYFLYVLAAAFARDVMAYRLFGNVNVALASGVLQFVAVFVLAWRYTRHARAALDPLAAQIVADAEERVDEAVRRRATGPSAVSYGTAFGDERPYLGPTPPDGMTSYPGPTPPDGMAAYPGPTPPDGMPLTGGTR
ncbi:DUF485 domain-containing protein [Actinoallomurus rhizosphaericola]|uniref:DUF485 domain-containing protein n=1 Tax=Actinoallomurus rhizosphaericola TaxID=2952536 RepID=UPI002093025A|nr:DUF485 domain-containing protein [Actinoallomurus rhizosphaericola]MCO5998279.1 DUF485 domain-containing protein [Actinoallomurus rhizosphaericola]